MRMHSLTYAALLLGVTVAVASCGSSAKDALQEQKKQADMQQAMAEMTRAADSLIHRYNVFHMPLDDLVLFDDGDVRFTSIDSLGRTGQYDLHGGTPFVSFSGYCEHLPRTPWPSLNYWGDITLPKLTQDSVLQKNGFSPTFVTAMTTIPVPQGNPRGVYVPALGLYKDLPSGTRGYVHMISWDDRAPFSGPIHTGGRVTLAEIHLASDKDVRLLEKQQIPPGYHR